MRNMPKKNRTRKGTNFTDKLMKLSSKKLDTLLMFILIEKARRTENARIHNGNDNRKPNNNMASNILRNKKTKTTKVDIKWHNPRSSEQTHYITTPTNTDN